MKRRLFLLSAIVAVLAVGCGKEPTEEKTALKVRVLEYLPAPGQFINEGYDITTQAEACALADDMLSKGYYVSLGAWGGSITVGFNRSVDNVSGYDFKIFSNSQPTSSEAGIVWVMRDDNANGLPDDVWYRLSGSEDGGDVVYDYEVTYFKPVSDVNAVLWSDNCGGSGEVGYMAAYHNQASYYPQWVAADSYTLRGVRLADCSEQLSSGAWAYNPFDWGYADNYSSVDRTADGANVFDIDNAVDADGRSVKLERIDFVKVQTAVMAWCEGIGECSTEVFGFSDTI